MKSLLTVALLAGMVGSAAAADSDPQTDAAAQVRAIGEAYVKAFNDRDAKALAQFWSPEAVYTNRLSGERVVGREDITKQFESVFQSDDKLKLKVDVQSIDFVSPNVAVENGVATFLSPEATPDPVDYSAVYIRREGKWLLDRVTDKPQPVVHSNYEKLKDLEWMIGSWVDGGDLGKVSTDCSWTKNRNFITRKFTVSLQGQVNLSGMQLIGWDPAAKQIRSWTFDSDGGFSEGRWSQDTSNSSRWYVRKKGTTVEGGKVTAVNIVTLVDDEAFTLQTTQRTLNGELLPNVSEVTVVRQ